MTQPFRSRLLAGERLLGTIVTLTTEQASEALAGVGYDWLWIDMEHGPLDLERVQSLVIAAGPNCAAVVRVPANDEIWLKRVLDLGPAGVIVPHVDTAEAARNAVRASRYPPLGTRSVGIGRAQNYGPGLREYLETAHQSVLVMPQIESANAVDEIEDILAVDGVDCPVVGPFDLSASLGHPGDLEHPEVVAAIRRVAAACQKAGKPAGLFAGTPAFSKFWRDEGFSVLAIGADVSLLCEAAARQLAEMRS